VSLFKVAAYVFLFITGFAVSPVTAQSLRELAREQAHRNPGQPIEQPASPGDYAAKTIDNLARESDLVLQGNLSRVKSYLSSNEDRILTDYSISQAHVITGSVPVLPTQKPGSVAPLTLTVYGGEVVIDGVTIRGIDNDRAPIVDGARYVLFLRKARQSGAGRYEIYYGGIFDISDGKVTPLLRQASSVFQGTVDARPEELVERVHRAMQRQ
jgi:hypothetical protein